MKVTIKMKREKLQALSQWANAGDLLEIARAACLGMARAEPTSERQRVYSHCARELKELNPLLEELHKATRDARPY